MEHVYLKHSDLEAIQRGESIECDSGTYSATPDDVRDLGNGFSINSLCSNGTEIAVFPPGHRGAVE